MSVNTKDSRVLARQIADLIRRFVAGAVGRYEWDDFMGIRFHDPDLERLRIQANAVLEASMPHDEGMDEGAVELLEIATALDVYSNVVSNQ